MLVVDPLDARPHMGEHGFADFLANSERREVRSHTAANVMVHEIGQGDSIGDLVALRCQRA